jgi:electron transfer flavoprotein alpha subunit
MAGTLVVARCDAGRVDAATRELVTAAAVLDRPVILGIIATRPEGISDTTIAGIDRIVGIRLSTAEHGHAASQQALAMLMEFTGASAVLMPFAAEAAALGAGLAQARDLGFASDVVELLRDDDGAIIVTRPIYGGKAFVTLRLPAVGPAMVLLRPGRWASAAIVERGPPLELVGSAAPGASRIRRLRLIERADDDQLNHAQVIFAVGRGVAKPENITTFTALAQGFGASLGASRPVTDTGLLPAAHLIGQSGATVRPKLYVAFGISGALQHLAGIMEGVIIVAVNTDRDAPIFDVARYGACVDALEVARQLQSLLPPG